MPAIHSAWLIAGTALLDAEAGSIYLEQPFTIYGQSREISDHGASIVIHSVTIDKRACAKGMPVQIILELPVAQVRMDARLAHCALVDEKRPDYGYLLGADIIKIDDEDRRRLVEYLKSR